MLASRPPRCGRSGAKPVFSAFLVGMVTMHTTAAFATQAVKPDGAAVALVKRVTERLRAAGHAKAAVRWVGSEPYAAGEVHRWRLRNGLRVLVMPDAAGQAVAYQTWIRAGSADETAAQAGIAHLLEHLMFKGTRRYPAGVFDRELERHGGAPNAATWLDYTMYHQMVPPGGFAAVAAMEADRLTGLLLSDVAVQSELSVVVNERREEVDNTPDGRMDEVFLRLAYGEHPYGRPTLGTATSLAQLGREDAESFYRRHYAAPNAVIVIAGAVDPADAIVTVVEQYQPATATDAPEPAQREPPTSVALDGPQMATITIDASSGRLVRGWLAVPGDHADHPLLTLAAEVLTGGTSARLDRALVRAGLASDVSASIDVTRGPGLFEIRVWLQHDVTAHAVRKVLDAQILAILGPAPPSQVELDAARNRLRRYHFAELASLDGRASALGEAVCLFDDPSQPTRWWAGVEAATPKSVHAALVRTLTDKRRVELEGRPTSGSPQ